MNCLIDVFVMYIVSGHQHLVSKNVTLLLKKLANTLVIWINQRLKQSVTVYIHLKMDLCRAFKSRPSQVLVNLWNISIPFAMLLRERQKILGTGHVLLMQYTTIH